MSELNHSFYVVAAQAEQLIQNPDVTVYQKFTCGNCGSRQTMDVPNKFFTEGVCEDCGFTTDIVSTGCGFLAIVTSDPEC